MLSGRTSGGAPPGEGAPEVAKGTDDPIPDVYILPATPDHHAYTLAWIEAAQ